MRLQDSDTVHKCVVNSQCSSGYLGGGREEGGRWGGGGVLYASQSCPLH